MRSDALFPCLVTALLGCGGAIEPEDVGSTAGALWTNNGPEVVASGLKTTQLAFTGWSVSGSTQSLRVRPSGGLETTLGTAIDGDLTATRLVGLTQVRIGHVTRLDGVLSHDAHQVDVHRIAFTSSLSTRLVPLRAQGPSLCGYELTDTCSADVTRPVPALVVPGRWTSGVKVAGTEGSYFTFACPRKTLPPACAAPSFDPDFHGNCAAKAILDLGYRPTVLEERELHSVAASRVCRDDLCGDGVSWTEPGVPLNVYDLAGIAPDTDAKLPFEASWNQDGAVCGSALRLQSTWKNPAYAHLAPGGLTFCERIRRTDLPACYLEAEEACAWTSTGSLTLGPLDPLLGTSGGSTGTGSLTIGDATGTTTTTTATDPIFCNASAAELLISEMRPPGP